jgi:hypothetical protein
MQSSNAGYDHRLPVPPEPLKFFSLLPSVNCHRGHHGYAGLIKTPDHADLPPPDDETGERNSYVTV